MAGPLFRWMLRRSLTQIRHVSPVVPGSARDLVAAVYRQVEQDFGMLAPPIALHSPAPDVLAASWLLLRETLLARGRAERADKEAIATAVSQGNTCPYCVDVHGAVLRAMTGPAGAARPELSAWALAGEAAPFPAELAPEMIGVAVTFHYLNRMVNVFLDGTPVPAEVPSAVRGGIMRLLGRNIRPARGGPQPGGSLALLPAAALPEDLYWASGNPEVAAAFARAASAIEAAGERSVPAPVRELVLAELARGNAAATGLSRAWVDEAVSGLDAGMRPAGTLALLVAMASYRVGQPDIDAFRQVHPGDRALVELASWASLAAARRAARRLAIP